MNRAGFTLVELLVVMAIVGILLGIATLGFDRYSRKSAIENEIKTVFADIMNARNQALFQRRARAISMNGTRFMIYSSAETTAAPIQQRDLAYSLKSGTGTSLTMVFDTMGLYAGTDGTSLCVDTGSANDAVVDSIVLSKTRLVLGKWTDPGGECSDVKIDK